MGLCSEIKSGWEDCELYGFLTTEANDVVAPYRDKAMPVFLTTPDAVETWLTAPRDEAKALQEPLPDTALQVIDAPPKRQALPA